MGLPTGFGNAKKRRRKPVVGTTKTGKGSQAETPFGQFKASVGRRGGGESLGERGRGNFPPPPAKESSPPPLPPAVVGPPMPPPSPSGGHGKEGGGRDADVEAQEHDGSGSEHENGIGEDVSREQTLHLLSSSIPLSHQLFLRGHTKAVTALGLDKKCSRLISGGSDYNIRMWNFAGMDSSAQSFRHFEPSSGHQIRAIEYDNTGSCFIVAPGDTQVRLYNRDGKLQYAYKKGDPYISDMKHTKGHVAAVTCCKFDPIVAGRFMSASSDGTLRTWRFDDEEGQLVVMKAFHKQARRIAFTTCAYSPDGKIMVGAASDGSMQFWDSGAAPQRPTHMIEGAHEAGSETSCVVFTRDNRYLVSRGGDDTMKVWDVRMLGTGRQQRGRPHPALQHTIEDLPNFYATTSVVMSPCDNMVVTGTSARADGTGLVSFYRKGCWTRVRQAGIVPGGSAIRIIWNRLRNQLAVSGSDGVVRMLYDPEKSTKGAILAASRDPRPADPYEYCAPPPVRAPHANQNKRDFQSLKRKREKDRMDPIKSRRPAMTTQGPGAPNNAGSSLTQHLKTVMGKKDGWRLEDPREAILRHAREAEENPLFSRAYAKTQPQTIFHHSSDEEE